jgi:hypothetical protein
VQEVIPETPKIPEVTPEEPVVPEEPVTPTEPYVPVIVPPAPATTPTEDTTRGHYTLGAVPKINTPSGLNPGWITNVPEYYHNTSAAADKFYWGQHPYQPGQTFDPTLYNTLPNAPVSPFGATYAQTSATPQQILAKMQGTYPLLGTQGVNGPVAP